MLFAGRVYIARGPQPIEDFCNIFLLSIGKDQKKSYHLRAGPLALCHVVSLSLAEVDKVVEKST